MKSTDFARLLTRYLGQYLPGQRNLSRETIQSYRDTFKLLLRFCQAERGWPAEGVTLAHLDLACLEAFLDWLETVRHCSITTRNQRLAALHAFFRWVAYEDPAQLVMTQRVLAIPRKKGPEVLVPYLTQEAVQRLLAQPSQSNPQGRRDTVLLSLLYDTGARVQELVDLRIRDIRLEAPSVVTLTGKGSKRRTVPLMTPTAKLVHTYLAERHLDGSAYADHPLFFNPQRQKLTRWGVTYVLHKYVNMAQSSADVEFPPRISPHVLRHSKAVHLLQSGVNLIYIRDFLGHSDVTTTEIYARVDAETRRLALEATRIPGVIPEHPSWAEDADLLQWLKQLCRSTEMPNQV